MILVGRIAAAWVAAGHQSIDGGLAIAGGEAVGGSGGFSGDIRIGENYGTDQSSQIALTSTQLTGREWVGPTVRSQNDGQDAYLGIYFWNDGNPELALYKRSGSALEPGFTQLGSSVPGRAAARRHCADSRRGRLPDLPSWRTASHRSP